MRNYLLILSFLVLSYTVFSQIDTGKIDSIVQKHVSEKDFEGAVLVADQGEKVYFEAFGLADREKALPNQKNSKFAIASITKMFTSILILQLVEGEDIKLDDKVGDLLPDFDLPGENRIRIRDLLLHTSGLPNEPSGFYSERRSERDFVKTVLRSGDLRSEYGKFNYANIDYVLLGLIIEEVTGDDWQEVMEDEILDELDMDDTGFLSLRDLPSGFSFPCSTDENKKLKKDRNHHYENYAAAGSMYSTAEDLLKLDQALYEGELLSKKGKELLSESYPEFNYSGYGVWNYRYPFLDEKPLVMERRGGILGANSVLLRLPEMNRSLIILSNNDNFDPDSFGDPDNLREAILRVMAN